MSSKVKSTGGLKGGGAKGGPSGKVGTQGGSAKVQPGRVFSAGNAKGSGKWASGGSKGMVGKQGKSSPVVSGRVSVSKGK